MSRTPSTMLPLGTSAPDFQLPDTVTGATISLGTFTGCKALLVAFICNHCPYVIHVKDELADLGRTYRSRGVALVAISANDISTHPDDAPENMKAFAIDAGFTFPYCYDESQAVAKAYHAACTPDFFLFDAGLKLVYRGQLDDSRPGSGIPVTGRDMRAALDALLAGEPIAANQKPSMGCNIKWKSGNAPVYA